MNLIKRIILATVYFTLLLKTFEDLTFVQTRRFPNQSFHFYQLLLELFIWADSIYCVCFGDQILLRIKLQTRFVGFLQFMRILLVSKGESHASLLEGKMLSSVLEVM